MYRGPFLAGLVASSSDRGAAAMGRRPGDRVVEEPLDLDQDVGREALPGAGLGQDVVPGGQRVQPQAQPVERHLRLREVAIEEDDEGMLDDRFRAPQRL